MISEQLLTGTTYIRWGRKTCRNGSALVYKGNNVFHVLFIYLYMSGGCQQTTVEKSCGKVRFQPGMKIVNS